MEEEPAEPSVEPLVSEGLPVEEVVPADADRGSAGWVLLATSGLSVACGVALDTIPDSSSNGQVDPINFVPVGLYMVGVSLGWVGIRKLLR